MHSTSYEDRLTFRQIPMLKRMDGDSFLISFSLETDFLDV